MFKNISSVDNVVHCLLNSYFREGLFRSCWSVDHTKRPHAPEIVEFLATNPRLLFPCLDVPLSSVQIEHSGQMQMPHDLRKFSFPLSWPQQSSKQTLPYLDTSSNLLDVNADNDSKLQMPEQSAGSQASPQFSEEESLRPLLRQARYTEQDNDDTKTNARYVNVHPGNNNIDGGIPMKERVSQKTDSV